MAIGHIAVRVHSRSKGHSAAAAVAYRTGTVIVDQRTGIVHDFSRRTKYGDVVATGMVGDGTFADVSTYAGAIELADTRKNSCILRDIQMALPCELTWTQGVALTAEFAELVADRYRTHCAWGVHRADRRGDRRNGHGHIAVPTRALNAEGTGFGRKLRVLDDRETGPVEIKEIRQLWESTANAHLARAAQYARVDVGPSDDPAPTLGAACTALEREEAAERTKALARQSAAALVTSGEPVTWRGRALRRHEQRAEREAEKARRAGERQGRADEHLLDIPSADARVEEGARPGRVDLRGQSRTPSRGMVACPAPVAWPVRIEPRREAPRRESITVTEAPVEPTAVPAPIGRQRVGPLAQAVVARPAPVARPAVVVPRKEPATLPRAVTVLRADVKRTASPATGVRRRPAARSHRPVAVRPVEVLAVAKPAQAVFARTVPPPVDARRARPASVPTPRRPAARSEPVVARPVGPVQVATEAAPTRRNLAALETPPSIEELSDQLYEEVYADQDAAAAVRPADPGHSLAIGHANWPGVQGTVRDDDALCRAVAARTAARAEAEGQRNYAVHRSWTERIADWIRDHVDAALELLRLRQREEAEVTKRGEVPDEDRVRLAVHVLPERLPRRQQYAGNASHRPFAATDKLLDRVAAAARHEFTRQVIAGFRKREVYYSDADRVWAEDDYLRPAITRRHQEALDQYAQAEAERGLFSRRPPAPTRAEAAAAVIEEYETELLGIFEEVCVDVQQRSPATVRSELQRLEPGQVIGSRSRSSPISDARRQERGSSGPSW